MPGTPLPTWADASAEVNDGNLLWKQYQIYVELYRFYVKIAWRTAVWYYTATGIVLVYYFDRLGQSNRYLPFALLFVAAMGFGLATLQFRGSRQLSDLAGWLEYIREQLGLPGRPHVEVVQDFLRLSGVLFAVISVVFLLVFGLSLAYT
jgi:hypothetical protein